MLLPGLRLQEREFSHAPCPAGNGTTIGDQQQFVVFCNTRLRGDELFRQNVDSLTTCTNICSSFQNPRCEGAQFSDKSDCVLIGNLKPGRSRPSRFFDGAVAVFPQPPPTSSCSQQGTGNTFLSQNSRFTLQCGKIANGNDLEQQFQMTLESCIGACSANSACAGVSFDPQQSAGFKNCYLKTAIDDANVFLKTGVDSAFLANNVNQAADPDPSTDVISTTLTAAISESTTYVTVVPEPGTVSIPVTVVPTSSMAALGVATSNVPTNAASAGADDGLGSMNDNERPKFGGPRPSASSNAWIAAPVIGGIAALTLVLAIIVLWQRRRRREVSSFPERKASSMSRVTRGLGDAANYMSRGRMLGVDKTRLRDSESDDDSRYGNNRGGFKVVSGSGRRLGLDGQPIALGTGPGLGGMIVTTGGGKVVDRSDISSGSSAGLRDSQNGLRQNKPWFDSRPGIPAEFSGPSDR
ncbi:hypothetical protein F5B22DRAFT_222391 [Xylaria bambusicola]|uniref:uncharacterized protein n=1 Tax=Xylaria bambusicola TaxID=326684 RepID=UPI0020088E07|nr:uncharacterized protein F5B22DRAFT_222391 [Xylaria bambusicola]KAI0514848.1 hypothetical protein F5B22DRAFT_222391 [Xylaria bambusicola]